VELKDKNASDANLPIIIGSIVLGGVALAAGAYFFAKKYQK
jgi:hypothetical protein